MREIIAEVAPEMPVFCSSELYPMRRDFPRLNSTLIEAYAAEPSREQLSKVRDVTRDAGAQFDLRIMASHGGTISIDAKELAPTLISGPIGGVVGARYLAEQLGNGSSRLDQRIGRRGDERRVRVEHPLHRHRRHQLRHRPDHRRRVPGQADARHRPLHPQPAAGAARFDRRRHGLVRAHRPQLATARAGAGLGRRQDRGVLDRGWARDALGDRSQPGPGSRQPGLLSGRRDQARHRTGALRDRQPR